MLTVPRVQKVYSDKGTGAIRNLSVFEVYLPSIPNGAYMIGQVAVEDHVDTVPTSSLVLVKPLVEKDETGDIFKPPVGYELVWTDKGPGGDQCGSFWRVDPPLGYVALGEVACGNWSQPSSEFNSQLSTPASEETC